MAKRKVNKIGKRFSKSLLLVADDLEKDPSEVTKAEYAASEVEGRLSDWELRKLGGFGSIQKLVFPENKNVIVETASKMVRGHRNKLNEQYGRRRFIVDEMAQVFREVLEKNPIKMHKPVAPVKATNKRIERTVVVHISDTHFGANVDAGEMDNVNEYNWTVAARRMAFLMDQVVTYKPQYRDVTELVMCINGDIIAGMIHNQEWFADLLTTQFAGALSILLQAATYAASHYKKVRIYCTTGNHGRSMHKHDTQRATTHKWDSYETIIYVALREALKNHKNIEVNIPETPYAVVDVLGHKFFVTHGDTVLTVGNPGKSLNMKNINDQVNKLNASLLSGDERFSAVLVGHVHTPTVQLMESGGMILINGCLIGSDPFAQSIGIFGSYPTQQLFEVVKGYAVGDIRLIQVKDGDKDKRLDKIIVPFKGRF